jgi:NAD(P)-dependent dehydrogenase (short-subunit alcohol dehydrogenase family)
MKLQGKVALVTGGGVGMGRAVAERFGMEGARVVIVDIDSHVGEQAAEAIRSAGGEAVFASADVSDSAAVEKAVQTAVKTFGGLDVLYSNAAVQLHGQDARAHELDEEVWDRTYSINIRGVWLCAKHAIPAMLERGRGSIINVASPTGMVGCAPGYTAYSSSKGAVFALTRVLAVDYASDNIRANAVIPGVTDTPLIAELMADEETRTHLESLSPLGRVGTPEDVTGLAVFLASEDSTYCTGGYYAVDGGLTAI